MGTWTPGRLRHLDQLIDQLTPEEQVLLWTVVQFPDDVRRYVARTVWPTVELHLQEELAHEDPPAVAETRAWLTLAGRHHPTH